MKDHIRDIIMTFGVLATCCYSINCVASCAARVTESDNTYHTELSSRGLREVTYNKPVIERIPRDSVTPLKPVNLKLGK